MDPRTKREVYIQEQQAEKPQDSPPCHSKAHGQQAGGTYELPIQRLQLWRAPASTYESYKAQLEPYRNWMYNVERACNIAPWHPHDWGKGPVERFLTQVKSCLGLAMVLDIHVPIAVKHALDETIRLRKSKNLQFVLKGVGEDSNKSHGHSIHILEQVA